MILATHGIIASSNKKYLLDIYTGSTAAYSLRKLREGYTGYAIRVRRSSDNSSQDIGFDGNGNLDTTAITSFVGVGNGFVSIWYDQSGNGKNLIQPTSTYQPFIIISGNLVIRNSKPAVRFENSFNHLYTTSAISTSIKNNFTTLSIDGNATADYPSIWTWRASGINVAWMQASNETRAIGVYPSSNKIIGDNITSFYANNISQNVANLAWGIGITLPNANTNLNLISLNQTSTAGNKYMMVGADPYNVNVGIRFNGSISESIFFENESTSINAINTNINSYYSIY